MLAAQSSPVHKARLRSDDGPDAEVAVKVQRPGIRATVEQDLDILLRMAARLEDHARWARSADERDRRVVTGLTYQFLLTLIGAASGIVAALLLGASGGPEITSTVSLYQVIGYNLLIVAAILVLRVLFTIFRNR
jgi:ubiquinone biosynthesis protein